MSAVAEKEQERHEAPHTPDLEPQEEKEARERTTVSAC